MKIKRITASGYRNIKNATLEFSDGVNLLYGKNGAGKTNALEAVYLFAMCKSLRTSKEKDFIMHGENVAELRMEFSSDADKDGACRKMGIDFFRNSGKRLLYEGVEITKVSEFLGRFRAVFFTPDHLSLIKGSPDERRRFADMALSQIKPSYIRCLNEYNRILSQRNNMLKNAKAGEGFDSVLFEVYSNALAESAAVITKQRAYFAEYLEKESARFYSDISGMNEKLFIKYLCPEKQDPKDISRTREKYIELYTKNTDSEIKFGATKYGPHKDDLLFYIGKSRSDDVIPENSDPDENYTEFAARTFGSQGQQRSAVLALKLAEGEIICSMCGEYPVYLFDDVLSELDNSRKHRLMSLFDDKQVLITCCDENAFDASLVNNKILVEDGCYMASPFGKAPS